MSMEFTPTLSQQLEAVLRSMVEERGFVAAVLTTPVGLPLSSALREERSLSDILAAVAPVLEQAAQRTSARSGLEAADEVVIRSTDRTLLVCRFFGVGDQSLILASIVPKGLSYRRVMNDAIRSVRAAWSFAEEGEK